MKWPFSPYTDDEFTILSMDKKSTKIKLRNILIFIISYNIKVYIEISI